MFLTSLLAAGSLIGPVDPTPSHSPPIHTYDALVISPAGDRIATVERERPLANPAETHGVIVVRAARDGRVLTTLDPCTACRYDGLSWSPDGAKLAFLATDGKAGTVAIDIAREGITRTIATLTGVANTPRFSPDGRRLALLATIAAKKRTGALEAGAPQVGEIGATPDEQRIALIPVDGGELRLLSPDDTFVYEYDWTPDGRALVGTAAKGDGDNNWWIATLNAFDATTGAVREIAHPDYQMSMPRVAPDGRSVVFVGGLMSDFGAVGGELYSVPIEGGVPTSLTPGFKGSFTAPLWRGAELYATALIVDRVTLVRLEGPTHTPRALWSIAASAQATDADVALSRDGRVLATVVEDFERAPSILAGPVGKATTLTHDNDALTVRLDVKSVLWKNEGFEVQGWLVGPAERPAGARYPLIVHVHGGPSAAALPIYGADDSFYATVHEWAARGYYLFLPNPRGSYGQGEAFTRANIRDFGGGDFRDIMTGIDAAAANAPIDTERLGIHGHSYGGFMVMWAVTHTHRFKAAVGGAGLSNWISYYGENGIDTWMTPFFGATMYDEPGIYRAASPIESIKQAKTPTLLYTGELDVEVPAPQSFEFWHGLKAMGVPTELHVYPGEGHLIQKPESISDLRKRVPGWFDKYLKP